MPLIGTVRARKANCLCEHGYKEGIGWPDGHCANDAGYYSYDEKMYLCPEHAEERIAKEGQAEREKIQK